MIKPLHPTLKACRCGFIGTRHEFYKHLDLMVKNYTTARLFFESHGEVPLNSDDPRIETREPHQITRQEIINSL